ncbi:uncharacterized protein LOC131658808 [Vicia villosa]|uniref:uncharacterized protein LOC131658808 n=1 Tax=Vicia villosa TaxID=3911 RepID=UPI00273C4C60|nr:uncharacterized protein LOC131658808 [Vicia villosa]
MHACLPLPKAVIAKIDSLCRTFVWTGKIDASRKSPVAWNTVCRPKSQGGQGVIHLATWNVITMVKCLWNLSKKTDNLWVKWVHVYYLKGNNVMTAPVSNSCSWIFKRIMDIRSIVLQVQVVWNRMLASNRFNMTVLYKELNGGIDKVDWRYLFYQNKARPRAQFIAWIICHGKQATKDRMVRFNLLTEANCDLCRNSEESRSHLYFECPSNSEIWKQVLQWLQYDHQPLPWQGELQWIMQEIARKGSKAKLLKMAFTETLYVLWIRRNNVIFNQSNSIDYVHTIIDAIVYRSWAYRKIREYTAHLLL